MIKPKTFSGVVQPGDQTGRTIGIRTANFDPYIIASEKLAHGVYASKLTIDGKKYKGALYYGPRLVKGESHTVLEIHVIDFSGNLYGKTVSFSLGNFIRGVMNFSSWEALKKQLQDDIQNVKASS